ncbi:MAG: S8 family serine peptidase [Candidatus Poseidoniaceae archaeon]|nr:S8 family serine peptidase [Candidatus Poseidoniaceae archaeon]
MHLKHTSCILLSMFLLSLASPLASSQSVFEPLPSQTSELTSSWDSVEPVSKQAIRINPVDSVIDLASLSFDPLSDDLNLIPSSWRADNGNSLYLLQLNVNDGSVVESMAADYDFTILEAHGSAVWTIRIQDTQHLEAMNALEEVRWIGDYFPGMKIGTNALGTTITQIVLASDTSPEYVALFSATLAEEGADIAWCSSDMCEAYYEFGMTNNQLQNIAFDQQVLFVDGSFSLSLHNNLAATEVGAVAVRSPSSLNLDGSGETIAVMDTGVDMDHPDLLGRIAAINTQFGLDSSPIDSNSGHGTHVAMTVLGDGTGDSIATGIAPEANLVMYALEHDPTGVFGRQGSIYDLLSDAELKTASVAVNAWGLNGNYGAYTADSRSTDQYVSNNKFLLPIFSVGDNGGSGSSKITAPGTAKNVLSIGSSVNGSVSSYSSEGPTLDGRIKPDLVAPGDGICSARAEEAISVAGSVCGTGTHSNGLSMYMQLSGTSQATAVAGGSASLAREYLREVAGINKPSASLIKATLINGAEDLGTPDIPNANEGWGQIDLENSLNPTSSGISLDVFQDDERELQAGFSLIYSFDLDGSKGIDITLAWSDAEASANAAQSESRLLNNLDLILIAPDGTSYLGNHFASGVSLTGGTADDLNNIERIRIPAGATTQNGDWMVSVEHKGGNSQRYSIVVAAEATLIPKADLTVFGNSILPSSSTPLVDDLVSISLAWHNQGTLASGPYRVQFEDVTTGSILYDSNRTSLEGGSLDSVSFFTQFATTGVHKLRLSLDTSNQVQELNDGLNGIDNNIIELDIEVTAQGLRVIFQNPDGSIPTTSEDRDLAATVTMDVRNETGLSLPFVIAHEGTGERPVSLTVSSVQEPDPIYPTLLLSPEDSWSKSVNQTGVFTISGQGDENDTIYLMLNLDDTSASFDGATKRYARAGSFIVDVTARYQNQPTVSHTQRLHIEIGQVDSVDVVPSGTSGVSAKPGESTGFSIGVRNTGNSAAQYTMSCTSASQWQIMLGNSNSSSLEFEPLNILQDLSMDVNVFIPSIVNGEPLAGSSDQVTCTVTSPTDPTLNRVETVDVSVSELKAFRSDLYGPNGAVGPGALALPVFANTGELVYFNHTIQNKGNVPLDFAVTLERGNPAWGAEIEYEQQVSSSSLSVMLGPGQSGDVEMRLFVPETAREGNSNTYTLRVESSPQMFTLNSTSLVVGENLGVNLLSNEGSLLSVPLNNDFTFTELIVENTGNADLDLEWSTSLAPDGWSIGYSNPPSSVSVLSNATVQLAIQSPNQTGVGFEFDLQLFVNGSNAGRFTNAELTVKIVVPESSFAAISITDDTVAPLMSIPRGDSGKQSFTIINEGNIPFTGDLTVEIRDVDGNVLSDRKASISPSSISNLNVGDSIEVVGKVSTDEDSIDGRMNLVILLTTTDGVVIEYMADTSVSSQQSSGGIFGILPAYVSYPLVVFVLLGLIYGGRKLKQSSKMDDDGTELVAPDAFTDADHLGTRRDQVLDISHSVNDIASGEVSQDEIAAALAQSLSMPAPVAKASVPAGRPPSAGLPPAGLPPAGLPPMGLPPVKAIPDLPIPVPAGPPLPPGGLPAGWTMEQWNHYGEQYLQRMGLN